MARPPKPLAIHKLNGSFRQDRHGSRLSSAGGGKPAQPRGLEGEARRFWRRVVPELTRAGIVEYIDTPALHALCELWALYRESFAAWTADPTVKNSRIATLDAFRAWSAAAQQFGLSPVARAKIHATPPEDVDPLEELLRQ